MVQLVVGRIGKAHGVKGEVSVEVRTDDPDHRFAPGAVLDTEPDRGRLVVQHVRPHAGRLLVRFDDVDDRSAAEALRGTLLVVDSASVRPIDNADEWWDHDLVGLQVVSRDGALVGEVVEVVHIAGGSLLAIRRGAGDATSDEVLVPFVTQIVPDVDVAARRITIDPPPGLLDAAEAVVAADNPARPDA